MKFLLRVLLVTLCSLLQPVTASASAIVGEGDEAIQSYAKEKGKTILLVQKDKEFILRTPDGKEQLKPEVVKVKVGQRFYIVNEEHGFVHNVYDETDKSWVLKKQVPSGVASITFDKPGTHSLRCAIHPAMKTIVEVSE